MRVMLIPFQVEVEELDGQTLGESPLLQRLVARLGTLLDKAAEFDASMAVAMILPRLGSILEQLLENGLGKSVERLLAT